MSKIEINCDSVIVGAGTAGLEAYKVASTKGLCILVESGPLGTTAQRTGDTPLTLLIEAGRCARELYNIKRHGVNFLGEYQLDSSGVMNALRSVRARATTEVLSFMYRIPEGQRIIGKASFVDENTLQVDDEYLIHFKTAVIATGTYAQVPYQLQNLKGVLTTDNLFEEDRLPKAVAIIGAGACGLELGQALCNLGVEVAVFGMGRLWQFTDDAVIPVALQMLQDSFSLIIDSTITAIEETKNGRLAIYYLDENRYENYLEVDNVISTSIRPPKIQSLNLRQIGIELDNQGFIKVDKRTMQTSLAHIFAAGDVAGLAFNTQVARLTGEVAGLNARNFPVIKHSFINPKMSLTLTDPGLAVLGLSLDEMKERARGGRPFVCSEVTLDGGRFRILRKEGGIIRMYTDLESHQLLGCELCSTEAEHLAHLINFCISKRLTVEEIAKIPCYHPCIEEAIPKAARAALKSLRRKSTNYVN